MTARRATRRKRRKLGQLAATAICGNDITSSCLYVSALSILYAGRWAPLALLLVAAVLFLYRSIYAEVVGALPLNGGAYNALLNTTSKFRASMAACFTILSYMATAVLSADEAMWYAHRLWEGLPVRSATVVLLAVFMSLTILGITESSRVAVAIFVTHLTTLALLVVTGLIYVGGHGLSMLSANLSTPAEGGFAAALFFGFAAAMLGISGFESSANFVEEQADGVFPKTLRNMWIAVTIFNPAIALLVLAVLPMGEVAGHREDLLAHLGGGTGGGWLARLISLDACLVLSGAVLTSFVGVNGLVRRMTLDRCLPQFLLKVNRRGTTHRIIIVFFVLAVTVLLVTRGDLPALAGVYTISFLSVMVLFGFGNVLLKIKRSELPRPSRASWLAVILGVAAVTVALVGSAIANPGYLRVFLAYFIPTAAVVSFMLGRIAVLKACLYMVRSVSVAVGRAMNRVSQSIRDRIEEINSQQIVFFSRGDNVAILNAVMLYVSRNEHTHRLKIVTVVEGKKDVPAKLRQEIDVLDRAYPDIDIELVVLDGVFGPKLIQQLSKEWKIPPNLMFIGSPRGHLSFDLAELGGVRVII